MSLQDEFNAVSSELKNAPNAPSFRAGKGPPVLLIHGFGGTWRAWWPLLPDFLSRFDVLAVTLPGHAGGSPLPSDQVVSPATLADLLEEQLDNEQLPKAHIVGSSLGGGLALELARRKRAITVTAIAPVSLLERTEIARLVTHLQLSRRAARLLRPLARPISRSAMARSVLFHASVHQPRNLPAEHAALWLQAFADCPAFEPILEGLAASRDDKLETTIPCPILIIWPDHDRMTPAHPHAERFRMMFPQATHVTLRSAGHLPMWDSPADLSRHIIAHIENSDR